MSAWRALGAILAVTLGSAAGATPAITLGSPDARVVELAAGTDVEAFAARNGIAEFELQPLAGGAVAVRFSMEEGAWRAHRAAICSDRGVAGCGTDACVRDLGPEDANAPQLPAPTESLIEARVTGAEHEPRPGTRMLLLPRRAELASLLGAPASAPSGPVAGSAACPVQGGDATRGALSATITADGSLKLPAPTGAGLEPSCWDVVVIDHCVARRRPLSDYRPDFEPGRAVVLIEATPDAKAPGLEELAASHGLTLLESTPLPALNATLVRLALNDPAADLGAALELLGQQKGVAFAQHEFRYETSAHSDPFAWMNYGARQSGADRLQGATAGAGATVAVIDTGIDAEHPELKGRVVGGVDVTGYGSTPDRHGTAVAGLIAAAADNGVGAYGMAPESRIVPIKACQPESPAALSARCWSSTLARALDAAMAQKLPIINMSLGGPRDPLLERMVAAAVARGFLIVAAAGNAGADGPASYPAAYPGVLAIGAIDSRANLWSRSARGEAVALAAAGVGVPVPVPGETYPAQLSGTSMAAAHVSGVAALLLALKPAASGAELGAALTGGARAAPAAGTPGQLDGCAAASKLGVAPAGCTAEAVK